ncbi:hypothetical protein TNCV_4291271 [Trichonephila clavipes]|nr:hypothetical protein TNCV_4291271 [Trichonephila clavipes]
MLIEEWALLQQEMLHQLVLSMRRRCEATIATNLRNKKLINSFPPKIIWCYGIYPKLFDKMSDIEFHEGMPFDVEDITNAFVIIDDLMNEEGDDKRTFKLVHERKPS